MWPFSKRQEKHKLPFAATPEMLAEAKENPGGWVYQIAGTFGPNDHVPPEHIVGAYKVDDNGCLTGEFKPNPNYQKV
ncbi:hypothetical protein J2S30_002352 [Herbaspirillum rubrisubalbicans]|jgi:hypothetical protein|uniref:hypothetical protein n=1 Tax=Herbaspirillum rubrisubalbicans TaxID=80842 RepID=UPI00209FD522|nr:hypothetical protein [Herbaspirillum rubrisubalbicans]MCP1573973.1 hypothetical protein [Herbaspirillum rubrisubalbicans]